MSERRVIVNADDFGLLPEVNLAVVRAHREGVLSSASLLVNAPATTAAVALAAELPELGLGLHFALTELAPLTRCPTLAPGGRFPSSHGLVYARLLARRVPDREIREEVRAQFEAALALGVRLDHVDGHGHVHVLPGVLEAVMESCQEFGVRALRWPVEPGGGLKCRLLRALCRRGEPLLGELRRPAAFRGLRVSGRVDAAWLRRTSAALPAGISELMVHPATRDEVAYPGYFGARELAALLAQDLAERLPPLARFADLQ